MRCPNCETTLAMSERLGVEIDYCPECRGVWLDRGEIDRLLEAERVPARASAPTESVPPPPAPRAGDDGRGGGEERPASRKRGWSDLLDFG
jgi:uncharacterized protein